MGQLKGGQTMCAFCLPASLYASEFQGAGRQAEAKVCTIVCATQNLEAQGAVYSALKK